MSRCRWVAIAGGLTLFSAGLFTGCGGKNDSAAPTAGPTQADTTPQPADRTSSGGSDNDGSDEIRAIAAKLRAATFKGIYTLTATVGSSADALTDGQMVLYKEGDQRSRFDVTGKQAGQDVRIVAIQDGRTSLFCVKSPGGIAGLFGFANGEGLCVKGVADDQDAAASFRQISSYLWNDDATVLEKSSRTIAGMEADCYRAKDNQTDEISTACFSRDGALLYAKNEGDTASEIVATQITGTVSDADFDPPYPVTDIPGLGN
ncbi:MAG: hypothetical protein M3P30_07345 [Chloroflexota bacterium]|nr:hypothetical protein [Chloroflexota bacterium]